MQTGFYVEYGSSDSPILAIRTDIDALPISDLKKVSYSSKNNGFMHACGHDAGDNCYLLHYGLKKMISQFQVE